MPWGRLAELVGEMTPGERLPLCAAADDGEDKDEKLEASVEPSLGVLRCEGTADADKAAFRAPDGSDADGGKAILRGGRPLMDLSFSAGDGLGVGTEVDESLL